MKYILMHKNIKVVDIFIDIETAIISKIGDIHNINHTPVGISTTNNKIDRADLNNWWIGRSIPASRMGINDALNILGIDSAKKLLDKSFGLSLSDHYWIKPIDTELTWESVNFFDNDFSDDIGDILFGDKKDCLGISLVSPNNTSDGWLKKKWKIMEGSRVLIKSGSGTTRQEPYNEVIASIICSRLGIYHIDYSLSFIDEYPYSNCANFVTKDTELVSAYSIYKTLRKQNHISLYQHFINCSNELNIVGMEDFINKMIVLDYIIGNEDRHLNNFGALRNVDTLEYISPAPIFDSGTSLWFDQPVAMVGKISNMTCKPFKNSHEDQLKLVTSFEFYTQGSLDGIEEEIKQVFTDSIFVEKERVDAICRCIKNRISQLDEFIICHETIDELTNDVKENIAYSSSDVL